MPLCQRPSPVKQRTKTATLMTPGLPEGPVAMSNAECDSNFTHASDAGEVR